MRKFRVGFETMERIYEVFEQTGKLRTLKEEMRCGWASILALTHYRLNEKLLNDEMPAQVLPALGGIATDKLEMLGTGLDEVESGQKTIDITPGALLDAVRRARSKRPPSDSQAPASPTEAAGAKAPVNELTGPATWSATGQDGCLVPAATEGGGGVGLDAPAPDGRCNGLGNFGP
jgi:hypothetical protein